MTIARKVTAPFYGAAIGLSVAAACPLPWAFTHGRAKYPQLYLDLRDAFENAIGPLIVENKGKRA